MQRAVMKNCIRRNAVFLRHVAAPAAQGFKHNSVSANSVASHPIRTSAANLAGSSDARAVNCPALATLRSGTRDLPPQVESAISAQHFTTGRSQPQRVETLVVNLHQTQHDELTQHRPPLGSIQIRTNPKRAQAF